MRIDRVDGMIIVIAVLLSAMLVGMLFNVWYLAFFSIPILATALMGLGTLNRENEWGPTLPWVAGFGVISVGLFVWAGIGVISSQSPGFGGLTVAAGVLVYIAWPVLTLASGLLYALLYNQWLRPDVQEETDLPSQE